MAKTRAIIVGAGGIAAAWVPPLLKEKVDVVAVVDLRRAAAEARIATFGLKATAYDDLAEALRRHPADFLVDLTTPEAHCAVTCAGLAAGLHVIGEKPMAANMNEARRMVRTAEQTGKLYMVSQSRRWVALHDSLARTVAARRIGTLTTVNCDFFLGAHFGGFRDIMDSPLLLDMAIHHFDMARMISGKDPAGVLACEWNPPGSWYKGNVAASCTFEMTDGVIFNYRGSWCAEGCPTSWNGNWRIIGTQGTLLYENDQPVRGEIVVPKAGAFSLPRKAAKVIRSPLRHTGQHGALRELLRFLATGEVPQTECHDNIRSLAMVFAAIDSARKRRYVKIEV